MWTSTARDIRRLFLKYGHWHFDNRVTLRDHALQTVDELRRKHAPQTLVVAGFLHVLGDLHLARTLSTQKGMAFRHDACMCERSAAHVKGLGFPASVHAPIRLNAGALSYLRATRRDYCAGSKTSGEWAMDYTSAAIWRRQNMYTAEAIMLRQADDRAQDATRAPTTTTDQALLWCDEVLL